MIISKSLSFRWISILWTGLVVTACANGDIKPVACPNSQSFRHLVDLSHPTGDVAAALSMAPTKRSYGDILLLALQPSDAPATPDSGAPEAMLAAPAPKRIAVLSGGGQYGAYGAGFLNAWRQNTGDGIEFSVVTGISTGALQSTLVFLGQPADMADLVGAYAIDDETELAEKRSNLFGIPLKNSMYSLDPARARITNVMTADRIQRVADAAGDGRKLLVGIVDAREGLFYAFDLTALAASSMDAATKRQCYVEALMASSAVPAIFAPVYLDAYQYYDGGVRASVFMESTANVLNVLPADGPANNEIYLVFNGYLTIEEKPDLENSILATLLRTKSITFDQIDRYSVEAIKQLSNKYDVKWTHIPAQLCLADKQTAPEQDVFNAPFMACLIEEGDKAGSEPAPWIEG